jgi:hypothetical protein
MLEKIIGNSYGTDAIVIQTREHQFIAETNLLNAIEECEKLMAMVPKNSKRYLILARRLEGLRNGFAA